MVNRTCCRLHHDPINPLKLIKTNAFLMHTLKEANLPQFDDNEQLMR